MLECITGTRPYANMPMHQALMAIMNDDPPEAPPTVSDACADFLRRCLNKVGRTMLCTCCVAVVCSNCVLVVCSNCVLVVCCNSGCKKHVSQDPTQRWTADQLLTHRFLKVCTFLRIFASAATATPSPQLAEGSKLLERDLVQRLPPEEVRTATFVKQAMANTKVIAGGIYQRVYAHSDMVSPHKKTWFCHAYKKTWFRHTNNWFCHTCKHKWFAPNKINTAWPHTRPHAGSQQPISRHALRRRPAPVALPATRQRHEHVIQPPNHMFGVGRVRHPQHRRRLGRGAHRVVVELSRGHDQLHRQQDPQGAVTQKRRVYRGCAPRAAPAVHPLGAAHQPRQQQRGLAARGGVGHPSCGCLGHANVPGVFWDADRAAAQDAAARGAGKDNSVGAWGDVSQRAAGKERQSCVHQQRPPCMQRVALVTVFEKSCIDAAALLHFAKRGPTCVYKVIKQSITGPQSTCSQGGACSCAGGPSSVWGETGSCLRCLLELALHGGPCGSSWQGLLAYCG